MAQVDSTVVVKTFSLSQKEEKLKNKLFQGSSNQQQATRRPPSTTIPAQEPPRKQTNSRNASISQNPSERSNQPSLHSASPEDAHSKSIQQQQQQQQQNQQLLKSGSVSPQFQQVYAQIPEEKIDQFLKQMEDEMNNINKKQVSIGMMNQQTSIIKQQNEILNENQKQLAMLMEKIQNDDSISKQKQELVEQNKKTMKDLLEPINAQIEEIRSIYDQTKKTQHELETQIAGQSSGATGNVSMQDFLKQNGQLKQKLDSTSNNLQELLPNNLNVFQTLTNFNIDVYSRTIKALKVQIEDLQKEAQRAEIELEEREQKLNSLPNQDELLIPFQEAIQAHVDNIDFLSSHQIVLNKLGGQLDYDEFIDSLQDMCSDSEALWREYQQNMNEHVIAIPKFSLTNQELNEISYNMPSVLDDIKERLGLDPSKPMKNPGFIQKQKEQQQGFIDLSKQDLNPLTNYAKTQALRPKNLESIRTEPKQCPKEVKYEQVEPAPKSSAYQTVLPVSTEGAYKQQSQSQTPVNNDARKWKSDQLKSFPTLPGQKSVVSFNQRDKKQQDDDDQDNYEDSFEDEDSRVEIKMDPQVILNLAGPYQQPKPKKVTAKDNEDTSQTIQIDMDNNFLEKLQIPQLAPLQQQQPIGPSLMDRESLKNIFLEVLNENKDEFFGQFGADEQSLQGDQIGDQSIENTQMNNQDNDPRRKLSDVISKNSKDIAPLSLGKAQSGVLSKGSYSQNVIPLQQSDRFSQAAAQQQQQQNPSVPSASIQAQTQDLALNFLNIINSTLTQISSAFNQPQNRDNQRNGDISEGSLTDDSMEAGAQQSRGAHSRGQSIPQMTQAIPNLQPQQLQMNNYPFQMFGQMANYQGYPGMYQQSDPRMMAYQQQQQPFQQRSQDTGTFNEAKINLNDYYKEYQLSDSDTISNQSALDMSKYDVKSNQSYAHSIFASDDQSRSNGEVSVPGRRPYGQNIERHQKPRDGQVMSDIELSQSNELSMDNFKRRQSQRQQGGSKKPATKVIGDDMWNVLSDDLSEGQI